jgi:hypothetical protein
MEAGLMEGQAAKQLAGGAAGRADTRLRLIGK